MSIGLFIRHRARPGQREAVRRIWEKHVRPRVESNPGHLAYFFCFDDADADTISVFQLYTSRETMTAFLTGDWYPAYLKEVSLVVAEAPQVLPAGVVWQKPPAAQIEIPGAADRS